MAKTKKYAIQFNSYNTSSPLIYISKAEYDRCLSNYLAEAKSLGEYDENNIYDSTENHIKINEYTNEFDTYIENSYSIWDGAATIWLYEYICKEGYKFKSR